MKKAKAFSPGNVSCVFRIIENKNRLKRHSLGLGFTVDKGVTATVSPGKKTEIVFNGRKMYFPTVISAVKRLTEKPVMVQLKSTLPISAGFGISGASALSTAYALNKLLGLNKTKEELAMAAHYAEVENSTGLGDVGGQYNGGVNAKFTRGMPLKGTRLNIKNQAVYYQFFSKIETKKVIDSEEKKVKINKAGDKALKQIKKLINSNKADLERITKVSKQFSVESNLLQDKRVKKIIKDVESKGGAASMIMLGNSVFANKPFRGCKKIKISQKGAYAI